MIVLDIIHWISVQLEKINTKMFEVKAKSDFAAKRIEYLYAATKQEKYCDSVFTVRNRSFYVHLIVLSACSEFFGINEGLVSDIFSDFDFEIIDAILKYCYTGEISIDDRHYEKLMELANRLEVKIPPQFKTVDLSNCLEVLKQTDDPDLVKKAKDLTLNNFETLHKTQDFLSLPVSTVIEILKSDDLIVPSERDVFNSVKLWVNYDEAKRRNQLVQLMSSVRLYLLSSEFLVNDVMKFCASCEECMTSLRQAVLDRISSINNSLIQGKTRRGKIEKIALVGGFDLDMAKNIDIYDGEHKSWTLSEDIGIGKNYTASVVVGNWIIIIGGQSSSNELMTSVEYIDLKTGQKHPLKPLNQPRYIFSAVKLDRDSFSYVYAIGGFGALKSVERWNSKTGNWEIIAPLLMAADYFSASAIDDNIFVTGGRIFKNRKATSIDKVQMYSAESDSWTYRAPMIQGRYLHSSVVFEGKLIVAGGYTEESRTDSVEIYDPTANLWTTFTNLPKPRSHIALCSFQNKIFCMGGFDGKYLNDVWEYDGTSKTWKASTSLSKVRGESFAHVVPHDSII